MKRILAAIDFSDVTGEVLKQVCDLGRSFGAQIRIVHTEPPLSGLIYYSTGSEGYADTLLGYGYEQVEIRKSHEIKINHDRQALDAIHEQLKANGVSAETLLLPGPAGSQIINEARKFGAELLIVGTHQHGAIHRLIFGSIRNDILNEAPCPVLFVPAQDVTESIPQRENIEVEVAMAMA